MIQQQPYFRQPYFRQKEPCPKLLKYFLSSYTRLSVKFSEFSLCTLTANSNLITHFNSAVIFYLDSGKEGSRKRSSMVTFREGVGKRNWENSTICSMAHLFKTSNLHCKPTLQPSHTSNEWVRVCFVKAQKASPTLQRQDSNRLHFSFLKVIICVSFS